MKKYKEIIGVIGAMKEEIEPLLNKFNNIEKINYANNDYYKIELNNGENIKLIIITRSKIGKVFAAMTSTILIEKFKCNKIIFSGVAGGINLKLNIGDIIIGDKICQHDFDISAFGHNFGYIPENNKAEKNIFFKSSSELNKLALELGRENGFKIHLGIIATGDQFISSKEKKEWIRNEFFADSIEMEGGAVAQVCSNYGIPFLIIRTISDTLEGNEIDFNKFLIETGKIMSNFIYLLINRL